MQSKRDKINFGLIGAGRIGKMHASNLTNRIKGAKLLCIADIYKEAADECAKENGIPYSYNDYHSILERKDIDAVVICTATNTHAKIIREAAEAGKHIFCEKPIALDLKEIDSALSAVERTGVKLQIGFNRRFDANPQKIRKMVETGELGKPHIIRITSRDPAPPSYEYIEVSGGIFLDMMIHDFDMARFLCNDEVEEVYATGNVLIDPKIGELGDIDTAIVTLTFKGGTIGTIDNSRKSAYGYDQRIEVFGSKGYAIGHNKAPDQVEIADERGMHFEKPLYFFIERYEQSFITELEQFIEAIANDTEPPVSGYDGKMAVVLGMAAKRSLAEKRPVKVL